MMAPSFSGSQRTRHSVLALLGVAICLGCRGCPSASVAPAERKLESTARPSKEWLEGKLPGEVYAGQPIPRGALTVRLYAQPRGLNRLHHGHKAALMVRITVGPIYETLLELDREDHPP